MKILDVSPRLAFPPARGSSIRSYNLLRGLSRNHEVVQFSQARFARDRGQRSVDELQINASYREVRYRPPLARSG